MARSTDTNEARRRFLVLIGGSAVAGLSACSGGSDAPAPAASAPEPAPEPAPEAAAEAAPQAEPSMPAEAEPAPTAGGELPHLSADDPTATSLGYVADATTVDQAQYPQYAAGQQCASCALFQGGDAEWGPCSIFPGKAVKATGWCSVYSPKAG